MGDELDGERQLAGEHQNLAELPFEGLDVVTEISTANRKSHERENGTERKENFEETKDRGRREREECGDEERR